MNIVHRGIIVATALLLFALGLFVLWPMSSIHYSPAYLTCHGRIANVCLGANLYASDFDDRFPEPARWMNALSPYTKNESDFYCPSVQDQSKEYGYAFSKDLASEQMPEAPERVVSVFESTLLARNTVGTVADLCNPSRHDGKVYIGYADGHVVRTEPENTP